MNSTANLIFALILMFIVGVVIWSWFTLTRLERDLRSLGGFEGMHFEIGPRKTENTEEPKWPIPG